MTGSSFNIKPNDATMRDTLCVNAESPSEGGLLKYSSNNKLISADVLLISYLNEQEDIELLEQYAHWKRTSGLYDDIAIEQAPHQA